MVLCCEDTLSVGLLLTLDMTTDSLVILTAFGNGLLWWIGFGFVCFSIFLRSVNETSFYINDLLPEQCFWFSLHLIPWAFTLAIKAFRVILIPVDCLLALGFYRARGKLVSIVSKIILNDEEEIIFGEDKNIFVKYMNLVNSFTGGGRWIAINLHHFCDVTDNDVLFEEGYGWSVLAEEVFENIGGILMAVSVFVEGDEVKYYDESNSAKFALSIASLVVAGISLFVETGYYIGLMGIVSFEEERHAVTEGDEHC